MAPQERLAAAAGALSRGEYETAISIVAPVLEAQPKNIQALLIFGSGLAARGNHNGALEFFSNVTRLDPRCQPAWFWSAVSLRKIGRLVQAADAVEASLRLKPGDPQARALLGAILVETRQLGRAEEVLRMAVSDAPSALPLACLFAKCLALKGIPEEACGVVRSALEIQPLPLEDAIKIGWQMIAEENLYAALEIGRIAIKQEPNSPAARKLLGRALAGLEQGEEASRQLELARDLDTRDAETLSALGSVYQALGRQEDANGVFHESLRLLPHQGFGWFALVQNRRITEADRSLIAEMAAELGSGHLAPRQASYLHYGLGKSLEDLGNYEGSIQHYDEANRIEYALRYGSSNFHAEGYEARMLRMPAIFSRAAMGKFVDNGDPSKTPIFVVGMMRSGTTLIEQVLSAHSKVAAGGEQSFWPDNWKEAVSEDLSHVLPSRLRPLGRRYVRQLEGVSGGAQRVVDKLPGNTFGLGLIHLALPNAKIIHIRRNPADTCFSIYATPNRFVNEFSHNRLNIVAAYRVYEKIMEQWHSTLPPGTIHEVSYEELINDRETVISRLLEFCDLDWEEACLRPDLNRRTVLTPSVWQVRQPIYRSAMGRWERYATWVPEFGFFNASN